MFVLQEAILLDSGYSCGKILIQRRLALCKTSISALQLIQDGWRKVAEETGEWECVSCWECVFLSLLIVECVGWGCMRCSSIVRRGRVKGRQVRFTVWDVVSGQFFNNTDIKEIFEVSESIDAHRSVSSSCDQADSCWVDIRHRCIIWRLITCGRRHSTQLSTPHRGHEGRNSRSIVHRLARFPSGFMCGGTTTMIGQSRARKLNVALSLTLAG